MEHYKWTSHLNFHCNIMEKKNVNLHSSTFQLDKFFVYIFAINFVLFLQYFSHFLRLNFQSYDPFSVCRFRTRTHVNDIFAVITIHRKSLWNGWIEKGQGKWRLYVAETSRTRDFLSLCEESSSKKR